ncbi:MAG: helix-turn-helix domain-containing protein [Rhodospirillaceae bacterium]|nr:helix-turn-helix domain-containing protein [Rhodospirillaceae bacterium]
MTDGPDLDGAAAAVFARLCADGPLPGRRLAKRLGLAQSEAFRALALLAEVGLIAAADDTGDALAATYSLTAAGEALRARRG